MGGAMKSVHFQIIFGFLINIGFYFAFNCSAQEILDLEALIQEALTNNPEIAVFQKNRDALWEKPPQEKSWEDPKLTFAITNLPTDDFDFNKQDMTQKTISIAQQIPFPGIASLREKLTVEQAKSADNEFEDSRFRIIRDVKNQYYQLYFINESIRITKANENLLEKFVELTQAKYKVGQGLQEDILKAQVELYNIQEKLIKLRQKKLTVKAELNRLLNKDPSFTLQGDPILKITAFEFNRPKLEEMALRNNAILLALKHRIEQNKTEHLLAKKSYFPYFTITASYGQRDDRKRAKPFAATITPFDGGFNNVIVEPLNNETDRPDFFSFLVGINIPIWFKGKQNKRVSETFHRVAQAKAQYERVKNNIFFKISDLTARIARDKDLIELYKNRIIPQATQSLNADIAAYQVAKIDFLTLLDSQITLLNHQLQFQRIMTDYENNLAELEVVIGKRFS